MKYKIPLIIAVTTTLVLLMLNQPALSTGEHTTAIPLYYDMVVDDARNVLYVTERNAHSLHVVSMDTQQITQTLDIGSGPTGIDISPDGDELAVALYGSAKIVFVDLNTLEIKPESITPYNPYGAENQPVDVLYGRPGRLYTIGYRTTPTEYVHVIDTKTKTEVGQSEYFLRRGSRIEMTPDQNTLYVLASDDDKFFRFDITTDTPVETASNSVYGSWAMCFLWDGTLATSQGQVYAADLSKIVKYFYTGGRNLECSEKYRNLYYTGGPGDYYETASAPLLDKVDYDTWGTEKLLLNDERTGVARLDADEKYLYVSTYEGIKKVYVGYKTQLSYFPFTAKALCPTLYSEDFEGFEGGAHGWPLIDDAYVLTSVRDFAYSIYTRSDQYIFAFKAPSCPRQHYQVESHIHWEGQTGSSYGLVFGAQPSGDYYYLFDISADYGAYRLYYRTPSGFEKVVGQTISPAISGVNGVNHLKVKYYAGRVVLIINGTEVADVPISYLDPAGMTEAGVVSMAYIGKPNSDARFDQIRITTLNAGGFALASASEGEENIVVDDASHPLPADFDWPLPPLDLLEQE